MSVAVLVSLLAALTQASQLPTSPRNRTGKFLGFDADDVLQDLMDEIDDPLPRPFKLEGKVEVKPSEAQQVKKPEPPVKQEIKITKKPTKPKVSLQNGGGYQLVSSSAGHFTIPMKTATENGIVLYGGQHYKYEKPAGDTGKNNTQEVRVFWSSVGDAIESTPFLPIQLNVPDMISAMATFLTNSFPLINRLQSPDEPRPVKKVNMTTDNGLENRELKESVVTKEIIVGRERTNQKTPAKGIFPPLPAFLKKPTESEEASKLFHSRNPAENVKLKNMPFNRKRFHIADREVFNFKNSDISNSPIMILNMPHRPMMYYKLNHQELAGKVKTTPSLQEAMQVLNGDEDRKKGVENMERKEEKIRKGGVVERDAAERMRKVGLGKRNLGEKVRKIEEKEKRREEGRKTGGQKKKRRRATDKAARKALRNKRKT